METLIKDIRYGVGSFLKRPGFLAIAVSTLALGIGAVAIVLAAVVLVACLVPARRAAKIDPLEALK